VATLSSDINSMDAELFHSIMHDVNVSIRHIIRQYNHVPREQSADMQQHCVSLSRKCLHFENPHMSCTTKEFQRLRSRGLAHSQTQC
jgi:hypothetical protein